MLGRFRQSKEHRLVLCLMEPKPRRICVSICERNTADLSNALARAEEEGDLVELRVDCLTHADLKSHFEQIDKLLRGSTIPTVVTFRPREQGGQRDVPCSARFEFWNEHGLRLPSYLSDLELDVAQEFLRVGGGSHSGQIDWSRVICSFHDFEGIPDLGELYARMAAVPARVLKIAVTVNDAIDCLEIFSLLARARADGREMIAIGMGTAGQATRILAPSRGAFLTYGASKEENATAPGQISAQLLRSLYRVNAINEATQLMGVAGWPVAHSLSPHVHNAAFMKAGLNAVYIPFEVRNLESFCKRMVHPHTREIAWNMRGLSVTAPHKQTVMKYLDWIDPAAEEIGAVNTVVSEGERLCGYNTDGEAVIVTLVQSFGSLKNARVAIVGAGGVARAALHGLKQQGAHTTVFVRDLTKVPSVAKSFGADCKCLMEASFAGFDVVINATPMGTSGGLEDVTPAAAQQLRGARLAYDLVYNPTMTRFLWEAEQAGCKTLGGLAMFVRQAAGQFKLWTGLVAAEDVMVEAALRGLEIEGSQIET